MLSFEYYMKFGVILALSLCCDQFVCAQVFASSNIHYVDPENGSDSNSGSLSNPWRNLSNSISKLKDGDTLYLRGGVYFESGIAIDIKGTESNWIRIKNYPGEFPTVDGGYHEFRTVPNSDWELFAPEKNIYRSAKTYPKAKYVYGYVESDHKLYRLVPYERYGHLSTDNQYFTKNGYIYVGAGVFWNPSDEKIYIRLRHSRQQISMGYPIPSTLDPRNVRMVISPHHALAVFGMESSYIEIEGIDFKYQNNALKFKSNSHHISIKNSNVLGGRTHILVETEVHDLIFDNIRIEDSIPPWIARSDVKIGTQPGHRFQGPAILLGDSSYNIEIKDSAFIDTWDGILAPCSSHNVHIHHNNFSGTRDDVVQLGSGCYDIEIDNNKMLRVSKGISRHGSGSPLKIGTKYFHHNIIDCSMPMLDGRMDPNNLLPAKRRGPNGDGMVWARPFGSHQGSGYGKCDPWKIYNNTIIFGKELNNKGAGHTYTMESFCPDHPHKVYNNIFIQTMDHWLSKRARVDDGSQIFDGNLYFRSVSNPTNCFFRAWKNVEGQQDFMSLSEFKSSPFFTVSKKHYESGWEDSGIEANPQLDSEYRPDRDGPAARGAVSLPSDWPGQGGGNYRGALPPALKGPKKQLKGPKKLPKAPKKLHRSND